ncbi:hypothetical protein [Polaromonas sp.]|uniref:hypothetical protein n=1 Tax=Polaromonas sp. TaxID=1869339 RepID=UPI00352B9136
MPTTVTAPPAPDWAIWANIPTCRVWQAICLSLNIDPDEDHTSISTWLKYGGKAPNGFPAAFAARLQVAIGNLGGKIRQLDGGERGTQYSHVRISDVQALFSGIEGWQFPDELVKSVRRTQREAALDAMRVPLPSGTSTVRQMLREAEVESDNVIDATPVSNTVELVPEITGVRRKKKSWRDVDGEPWQFSVKLLRENHCSSAKELYSLLEAAAAQEGSPFVKGEGPSRGTLFIPAVNTTLALQTLRNAWPDLRKASSERI